MMKKSTVAFTLLAMSPAFAATTPNSFVSPQTPNRGLVSFIQGTDAANTFKTLYSAGANGSRCYGMYVSSNDSTTAHSVNVAITNGGTVRIAVNVTVPISTGTGYMPSPTALSSSTNWPGLPSDQYGNPYIQLISGDSLQLSYITALGTASQINGFVTCSDF